MSRMVWNDNELADSVTIYDNGQLEFKLTFTSYPQFDLGLYFQRGVLVVEKHYFVNEFKYVYEFENNENISLKALRDLLSAANVAIKENKLDLAKNLLDQSKNSFPAEVAENIQREKTQLQYNEAVDKFNAEQRRLEKEADEWTEERINIVKDACIKNFVPMLTKNGLSIKAQEHFFKRYLTHIIKNYTFRQISAMSEETNQALAKKGEKYMWEGIYIDQTGEDILYEDD